MQLQKAVKQTSKSRRTLKLVSAVRKLAKNHPRGKARNEFYNQIFVNSNLLKSGSIAVTLKFN